MLVNIKNMVCPRCVMAVEQILTKLNIPFKNVIIGQAELITPLSNTEANLLNIELEKIGFEILLDRKNKLVEEVKIALLDLVNNPSEQSEKTSIYLSEKFNLDYTYISTLFSVMQGESIEKYLIKLRVEKIKELLSYDLSLAEIADKLQYSSVAHLSNQFKKITGHTASDYKKTLQSS